jgi:hypothetical protein
MTNRRALVTTPTPSEGCEGQRTTSRDRSEEPALLPQTQGSSLQPFSLRSSSLDHSFPDPVLLPQTQRSRHQPLSLRPRSPDPASSLSPRGPDPSSPPSHPGVQAPACSQGFRPQPPPSVPGVQTQPSCLRRRHRVPSPGSHPPGSQ